MNRAPRRIAAAADHFEGMRPTVDNLRLILGDDGARRLAEFFGGRRLYVPLAPGEHHPITVAMGQELTSRLVKAFPSLGFDVPMLAQTKAEIRRMDAAGHTRREIARQLRITERWVYKTLAEAPPSPSRQGRLFG